MSSRKTRHENISTLTGMIDSIVVMVALILSVLIMYGVESLQNPTLPIITISILFCVLTLLFFIGFEMYSIILFHIKERFVIIMLTSIYSYLFNLVLYGLLFRSSEHMSFIALSAFLCCILLLIWRELRFFFYKYRKNKQKLLIIEKMKDDNSRVRRIKYASLSHFNAWYEQIKVEDLNEVTRFIENEFPKYDGVCLMESIPMAARNLITHALNSMGKEFYIVPAMYELNFSKVRLALFDDVMVFHVNPYQFTRTQSFIKRAFDIIVSIVGIALAAIPMMIIAPLIKLTSPGPIFYKQVRLTQHSRKFNIYKFRTMVQDAEALSGPVFAEKDDPRITAIGRILRKLRMDELPQLFNILMGDMSVVGPRPERPFFVEQFSQSIENYEQRFAVKAGLTSLSHVHGRYSTDITDRTLYDLLYIRNYSFTLDLRILLLTTKIIFIGEAAEGVNVVDAYKNNGTKEMYS